MPRSLWQWTLRTTLLDAANVLLQVRDGGGVLRGDGVADRVGNVDRGGAGLDDALDDLGEEVEFGAGGVLGREFDVLDGIPWPA